MAGGRSAGARWRTGVWFVFLLCIALLSALLAQGFFYSAGLMLKLEAFAGFFIVGCVLLIASRRSAGKKKTSSKS
jgi:hypothetical protein